MTASHIVRVAAGRLVGLSAGRLRHNLDEAHAHHSARYNPGPVGQQCRYIHTGSTVWQLSATGEDVLPDTAGRPATGETWYSVDHFRADTGICVCKFAAVSGDIIHGAIHGMAISRLCALLCRLHRPAGPSHSSSSGYISLPFFSIPPSTPLPCSSLCDGRISYGIGTSLSLVRGMGWC